MDERKQKRLTGSEKEEKRGRQKKGEENNKKYQR